MSREYVPEVNELAGTRGKDPETHFRNHLLQRIPTPKWENHGDHDLPLLASPEALRIKRTMMFGGVASRLMATHAFETRPGSTVKYVGVAVPANTVPDAYMICFRHSAQAKDYPGGLGLLTKGVGDYLTGRMQISPQISASGKNIAAVVPVAIGGSGEFEFNEKFITSCLEEIEKELFNISRPLPPLLLYSNSDGIIKMDRFLKNCPKLAAKVRAIYDMDGSHVIAARGITLTGLKARVFRYDGAGALKPAIKEGESEFLSRTMGTNPARVPLPFDRWVNHFRYTGNLNDKNWLHHFIPTCMLQHGLVSTVGI
jgi:hypothetical protein